MGATRLASEIVQLLFSRVYIHLYYSCTIPDARRVAPISACVFYQIDRLKTDLRPWEELLCQEIAL